QGDGAPDSEALFASNVKAKQPLELDRLKAKAPYNRALFLYAVLRPYTPPSINRNISAIFQIYRP
ncbi:hypothetical protein ACXI9T_003320, partial [Bacillus paranthracis]